MFREQFCSEPLLEPLTSVEGLHKEHIALRKLFEER